MAYTAKQSVADRSQHNVVKQAGWGFIKKYAKAGFVQPEDISAKRGQDRALRQREHSVLAIVQRLLLQRRKPGNAAERGNAIDGGDFAVKRPLTDEGGEGDQVPAARSGCSTFGFALK